MEHTPLEWETNPRDSEMSMFIYGDCNTDNAHAIAVLNPQPDNMHCKDARYIVAACNAYPELVEALQAVVDSKDRKSGHDYLIHATVFEQARAALATVYLYANQ